jgi:uncharacterized protein
MKSALVSRSMSTVKTVCRILPIVALSVVSLSMVRPALADEPLTRTITVTGQGTENIPTTITQVQLGVEAQGDTAAEVQQEVARRSAAVVDLLRSRNVRRLQTTGISLSPVYNYQNNEQRIIGYSARNMVSFELDTERAGTLLDDAVKAGASRIDNVSFVASDEAIATARQKALREATEDAQTQAQAVLGALGLTSREVVNIQVSGAPVPYPMPVYRAAAMEQAAPSTPVVGGEQQIQASVTLQIGY